MVSESRGNGNSHSWEGLLSSEGVEELKILERALAMRALRLEDDRNLSNLLPEAMGILDELATFACKHFTEWEIDPWLNHHPIMQFLIFKMRRVGQLDLQRTVTLLECAAGLRGTEQPIIAWIK